LEIKADQHYYETQELSAVIDVVHAFPKVRRIFNRSCALDVQLELHPEFFDGVDNVGQDESCS
jgi:hypothetical protein